MPMASDRARTVIGGSISAWDLRVGARDVAMAASGLLAGSGSAGFLIIVGEQGGGRDGGRDAALARPFVPLGAAAGPIGGGAEAAAPVVALRSLLVVLVERRRGRPARRGRRAGNPDDAPRDRPGGYPDAAARRGRYRGPRWGWPGRPPCAGTGVVAGDWKLFRPPDCIRAIISSRVIDFSGRWDLGGGADDERGGPPAAAAA